MSATLLLLAAFATALLSAAARRNGQVSAAVMLAVLALILSGIVAATVIPRLLARANLELWEGLKYFRVTSRGALLLALIVLIGLATLNTGNNLLVLLLSFMVASLLVSGLASNLSLYGLKVSLNLPDAIYAKQKASLLLTLENLKRRFPSFALRLRGTQGRRPDKEETNFFAQEKWFAFLGAKGAQTVKVESEFRNRGRYTVSGFEVRTQFPFGFFTRGRGLQADGEIIVYPERVELSELMARYPLLSGPEVQNKKGRGVGLYNIRDYEPGDDGRFVHWKSTAKLSRLMVKEFIEEQDTPFQLVLSTYLTQPEPERSEVFEKLISYVASLAALYWEQTIPFTLYSGEFFALVSSRESFEGAMKYLARVGPSDEVLLKEDRIAHFSVVFTAQRVDRFEELHCVDVTKL